MEKVALVKQGKPISHHRGVEPLCLHCRHILTYATYECKHPKHTDSHEYKEPCTTLEWLVCPLNPQHAPIRSEKN